MKLPLYFISDCHIGMEIDSHEIERRKKLFSVFEQIKQSGGTLIIGGDFFDFWFHFRNYNPLCYEDVINELIDLKSNNIDIHYIAGNHDYWDFGFMESKFATKFYKEDLLMQIEGSNRDMQNILITHGDGLLKDDRGYRFMKKIIRSKIFITLFKMLGSHLGHKIAQRISNTSRHYNHFDSNADQIKKEMYDFAERKWEEKFNVVLIGHYHQKGIIEKESKKLIFLGDWLRHFLVTKFDGKKWSQFSWNEG